MVLDLEVISNYRAKIENISHCALAFHWMPTSPRPSENFLEQPFSQVVTCGKPRAIAALADPAPLRFHLETSRTAAGRQWGTSLALKVASMYQLEN
jgi:hypothetical protein